MERDQVEGNTVRWRNYLAGELVLILVLAALILLPPPSFAQEMSTVFLPSVAAGALVGFGVLRLLRYEVSGSLIVTNMPRYLNVAVITAFSLLFALNFGIAQYCNSIAGSLQPFDPTALTECYRSIALTGVVTFGSLLGFLITHLGWALFLERKHGRPLMVEIRSKIPKSIHGWPIRDLVLFGAFAVFLIYLFYRIFTLR